MLTKRHATRIAIVGPDGSGKTSVTTQLHSLLANSTVVYGGKGRDNVLWTTTICFKLWKAISRLKIPFLPHCAKFLVYYPAEFFEYLFRFFFKSGNGVFIFDRHPVDRIILPMEYRANKPLRGLRLWLSQWPYLIFISFWYRFLFPKIDLLIFLLPSADLCFERANGQYKDQRSAVNKLEAYRMALKYKLARIPNLPIEINREKGIPEICDVILQSIKGISCE